MLSVLQAILLGAVQGLTEFLPVSSTAHLILFPIFFGWQEHPLVFDTTFHLATAAAICIYFAKDLLSLVKNTQLGAKILSGSIPAAIVGVLFGDMIEEKLRSPFYIVLFLILGSLLMLLAEKLGKQQSNVANLSYKKTGVIGLFQALALLPGVSRSGATISGGMFFGLRRTEAAKFSFLLSVPIVLGAGVYKATTSFDVLAAASFPALVSGFLSSLIFGIIAIRTLMDFVKKSSLRVFVWYRVVLAVIITAACLF